MYKPSFISPEIDLEFLPTVTLFSAIFNGPLFLTLHSPFLRPLKKDLNVMKMIIMRKRKCCPLLESWISTRDVCRLNRPKTGVSGDHE